jgi:hypothetical protein
MSDGEGEDSFWGDRRDRRRRGRTSDSRSPSNRRSPSPPRRENRSEHRRPASPSRRDSYYRRGNTPSPSRRPRSPRNSGRYIERERAAGPRHAEPRYAARDGPSQRRRSPSPHRSSRHQHPAADSYMRPRSRSRDRRSPPRAQPEHRPLFDPMLAPTMLGSRDFRRAHCNPVRAEYLTFHVADLGSSERLPVLRRERPGSPTRMRLTASRTRNKL